VKTNIVILFFVGLCNFLIAQPPAPDFTVVDANGVTHQLYADHLDQGQTVVIKLFFINCPPCATYAPHVQQLYEDWGEGEYDVEFFEMSILFGDKNDEVADYQAEHELTFPGVGGDGGSVPALNIYKDGTYGPYYGTPTFVVIAPDGEVTYDPSGIGVSGTIEAINDAITATGAEGPNGGGGGNEDPEPVAVSLFAKDVDNSALENVDLYMKSEGTDEPIFHLGNFSGQFSFEYPSELAPEIENPVIYLKKEDGEAIDDVSTLDLVLSQRHILGIDIFENPYHWVASDVNSSGGTTAIDLVIFRQVILGLSINWPSQTTTWTFVDADCNFIIDPYGMDCRTIDLSEPGTQEIQLINMTGVKMGNVN
jgi:thiol-disulfide isomerase/thioredoxin